MRFFHLRSVFVLILLTASLFGRISDVQAANGFTLKDMDGKSHSLADYKGKWVLVNFWATWCPPCVEEIPELVMLHDKRKNKDFAVIGIAIDYKSKAEISHYVEDNLISYPMVLGTEDVVAQFGSADVLPTSYIYNPQGKLVKLHRGLITRKIIEKTISGKK